VSDDFHRLAHDLGSAAQLPVVGSYVAAAVERTALEVKDGWNEKLYTDGHAKHTGRAITYDMVGAGLSAEIGAKRGSGSRRASSGSSRTAPSTTLPRVRRRRLAEREANFESRVESAAVLSLRRAGLL
jgi:hypothetical protein